MAKKVRMAEEQVVARTVEYIVELVEFDKKWGKGNCSHITPSDMHAYGLVSSVEGWGKVKDTLADVGGVMIRDIPTVENGYGPQVIGISVFPQ